jgi:hypothetical protein
MPETFLLVYSAKKRAEIAPGVGKGTDLFSIGPPPGGTFTMLNNVPDLEIDKIQSVFARMDKRQKIAFDAAKGQVKSHIEEMFKRRAEQKGSAQKAPG